MKRTFLLITIFTLLLFSLDAQVTRMVTDLVAGADNGFSTDAYVIGTSGNSIAILDNNNIIISDGTEFGTKTIGDLGTDGYILHNKTLLNGNIYFIMNNYENDYSLIEIDPTNEEMNTVITDIEYLSNLVSFEDKLYCQIEGGNFGDAFISIDPSNGATEKMFDIADFGGMRDAIVHKGMIYTIHWKSNGSGAFLSKSNGTPGNVDEFAFLHTGSEFSQSSSINMTSAGDNLYFFYYSANSNYALWVSDGTTSGTSVLQEGLERISFFDYDAQKAVGTIGNSIFFRGVLEDDSNNEDLWISDGTIAGTCSLRIVDEDEDVKPQFFTNYNDKLYFYGFNREGFFGAQSGIIASDGTKSGTSVPYESRDHEDVLYYTGWQMTNHQDQLFFSAESGDYGSELYASQGTLETTTRVSELAVADGSSSIRKLTSAGNNLFFIGFNADFGRELYVYGPPLSSTDNIEAIQINITPNPASTYLQLPNLNINRLSIYNNSGTLIREIQNPATTQLDVANLNSGMYIVHIVDDQHLYTSKFIKI